MRLGQTTPKLRLSLSSASITSYFYWLYLQRKLCCILFVECSNFSRPSVSQAILVISGIRSRALLLTVPCCIGQNTNYEILKIQHIARLRRRILIPVALTKFSILKSDCLHFKILERNVHHYIWYVAYRFAHAKAN
mgnify:FL=1